MQKKRSYKRIDQCVYVLLDPRKSGDFMYDDFEFNLEPFYVGKGSEKRPNKHIKAVKYNWISPAYNVNPEKSRKISEILEMNLNPIVEIIQKSMGAVEACRLEIDLIDKIGRIDEKSGPLTNKTNGGDGAIAGCMSKETCLKMSKNHADFNGDKNPFYGKTHREDICKEVSERNARLYKGSNNPMFGVHRFGEDSPHYGKKHSEETKRLISKKNKGRKLTEEQRKNISDGHKNPSLETRKNLSKATCGKNNPNAMIYYCENDKGERFENIMLCGLKGFCEKNNLYYTYMKKYINKNIPYKGWRIKSIRRRLVCKL